MTEGLVQEQMDGELPSLTLQEIDILSYVEKLRYNVSWIVQSRYNEICVFETLQYFALY